MKQAEYIINQNISIRDALVILNGEAHSTQSLFIVNDNQEMVGTLSDGDIRRGLISGKELTDKVYTVMHTDFRFIDVDEFNVKKIKEFRDAKIFFIPVIDKGKHINNVINLLQYKSKLPLDVILMAGGKGERLRPLTEKTPKPLLPVGNKAIIDHNVDRLIDYGIEHISVTVNYLKEQLEEHYSKPRNGVKINCYREPKFLGTMGAVKFIPQFYNDVVIVMNSDLFTNIDYEDFYLHFIEHGADMSVAAVPYSISVPYGIFNLDGRNIKGVMEKPTYNYYANAGIYMLKRELFDLIPKDTFFNATDMIEKLISLNKKVIRFPLNGTWIDIGNPQEYKKAKELNNHMNKLD